MIVLGIDTSCDDTAVGVVADGLDVKSNIIASQHRFHERYGGVVPSIASRQHSRLINPLIEVALEEAGLEFRHIDAIAVSSDQGLAPSLAIGVAAAKSLSLVLQKPLVGVHHVEGHIYSNLMAFPGEIEFPFLCLTVAGGHTMILLAQALGTYKLLGHCRDNSAGEAYDKVARRLGLGFPGGPIIEKLASTGNPRAFNFPRPLMTSGDMEFSFSGLKSSVNRTIEKFEQAGTEVPAADIAASFQTAVLDVLIEKLITAVERTRLTTVAVSGGVAANAEFRVRLKELTGSHGLRTFLPPMNLCIDNGAMIAGLGFHKISSGELATPRLDCRANAPLGTLAVKYRHHTK